MKTGDEGKDCFFSYHAKAELPPWIFFFLRSCSAILSHVSNHPSAEFLYSSNNQLLRAKFDQLPEPRDHSLYILLGRILLCVYLLLRLLWVSYVAFVCTLFVLFSNVFLSVLISCLSVCVKLCYINIYSIVQYQIS